MDQNPCELQSPLRFPRQTNTQRSNENSQSRSRNAQGRSSQPPTTQPITTADNNCHHTKVDSAAQRGVTADHPTIQLREPLKSSVEETIETRSCTPSSNHHATVERAIHSSTIRRGNHSATAGERKNRSEKKTPTKHKER